MHAGEKMKNKNNSLLKSLYLSQIFTVVVIMLVMTVTMISFFSFVNIYEESTKENVITSSEQAVFQVENTVENYQEDIENLMNMILANISEDQEATDQFFKSLFQIKSEVVSVTTYDMNGKLLNAWSDGKILKKHINENLSYDENINKKMHTDRLNITKPHVETLFRDYYPWVVTISQYKENEKGERIQVAMDVKFSNIAKYVDGVGIGQHGYCYIADENGNIIYHPQQQLIYAGLKKENYTDYSDGTHTESNVIYSVKSLKRSDWKIVGVCFADEMITNKVEALAKNLIIISIGVLFVTILAGGIFSKLFSKPANDLAKAMQKFENDTDKFVFEPIEGTAEITSLTESFEHMVLQIQELVEKVRQEEISLRKTELKALQAQINPHFLYNTLDAIAWMCEEERHKDAVEMVNALARLFRISISRGHELISIEKEIEHAKSYLKIQNFRYKNQFTYDFEVDDTCLSYLCNKITLQPIIENAIYHGIDRMVDEGRIEIRIFPDHEKIIFEVEDNGVGMTEEQCQEILQKDSGDKAGIGIKNVNDRIKIYFGEEYGITIRSELDEGTCVTITMPKITEKDYVEK